MLRICIGFFFIAAGAAPDGALEWKWKENDEFWVEVATDYDQKTTIGEKEQKRRESFRGVFQLTVQKVADGGPTLSVKVHQFDYSGDRTKPVAEKMEGATFEVTLDRQLTITGMNGLDKVAREVPGAATTGEARLKFHQTIAETMNRYWLTDLLLAMPGKATKPGEPWEQKSVLDIPPMGRVAMNRTLKDDGSATHDGNNVRKIAVDVKFEWIPSNVEGGFLPFKVEKVETKKSDCTTTALFDPEAGRLVKSSSTQKYTLAMKMLFGGAVQDVETERDQTQELRVLDKNPLK